MAVYTQCRKKEGKVEDEIKVIARMNRGKKIRLSAKNKGRFVM
jgi:hypothetical protein